MNTENYWKPELIAVEEAFGAIRGTKQMIFGLESDPSSPYQTVTAYDVDE